MHNLLLMKILVLPDIHGRDFWKGACKDIDPFDKVIFLGDYFDPYDFERISVATAIENFQEILDLKRLNRDKVVLLLGNHDLPYMFSRYYELSDYHHRHSEEYHHVIGDLLRANAHLLSLSCATDNILFTHAGVQSQWFSETFHSRTTDAGEISTMINTLTGSSEGLGNLYRVSYYRGGRDSYGSCIWAHVDEMIDDAGDSSNPLQTLRQVFAHSLQVDRVWNYDIRYGKALEFGNCKMIDTAKPYVLDTDSFTLRPTVGSPLRQSYYVCGENIFAGEYPGDKYEAKAAEKIRQMTQFGVRHYIDLTEEGELMPYAHLLPAGTTYTRFPIRDVKVPRSINEVKLLMELINELSERNDGYVYIHCWGGVGRTGTIVACYLARLMEHPTLEKALDHLRTLFSEMPKSAYRHTPETIEQVQFVQKYIQSIP